MPRRNTDMVNASASGSGPIFANGSAGSSAATYNPILPNLRMSRKRISRPSSRARTSRTYGSGGPPCGTTNSWPVIFRWIVRNAPPDSSTTSCFARRPTASIRRPATPSANASGSTDRSVRAQYVVASTIVAPVISGRRSRATVSTSGSSGIGESLSRDRRERRLERQLVRLGGDLVLASQGRHPLPVVADLDVDGERHRQGQGALHRLADDGGERINLIARCLEQQLVVDAQEEPRPEAGRRDLLGRPDHCDFLDVGGRALDRHVDRHPLARTAQCRVRGTQLGDLAFPPEERLDVALALGLLLDGHHVVADPGVGREVRVDELL